MSPIYEGALWRRRGGRKSGASSHCRDQLEMRSVSVTQTLTRVVCCASAKFRQNFFVCVLCNAEKEECDIVLFVFFFCCIRRIDPVLAVCRRGNNSQLAVERMRALLPPDWPVVVRDIVGGLRAWAAEVDPQFPIY